ncbi:hypothetical protein QVD17_05039 [Tagetes erecta]|uniref:Uncharacterized protein n=1 Tax=Tagetes erecta TaxID=13708 RepID=A0AAD8LGN7_TARER|nr:hypothetical protein QVD17_05039 [Tagetes erecta]
MVRSFSFDKDGNKKGAWSEDEDEKLRAYIHRYGHWNWGLLPKFAGLSRSGKSCRLRWVNYLRPNMKHGNFTKEEDDLIFGLHKKLGNKWSAIAAMLPGRSDNEIKNRWNTHLKKRVHDDNIVLKTEHDETMEPSQCNLKDDLYQQLQKEEMAISAFESTSYSTHPKLSPCRTSMINNEFWTEPLLHDMITSSMDSVLLPLKVENSLISQSSCQDLLMNDDFSWSKLDTHVNESNIDFLNCWDSIQ